MKFSQDLTDSGYVVTAYDNSGIKVNGKQFEKSFIISPDEFHENWTIDSISELSSTHIQQLLDMKPELIIVGTGNKLVFPPVEVYAALVKQNMGVEFMDTNAACRTYNILTGEGRKVVAGIIFE